MKIISGFHAIEETLRTYSLANNDEAHKKLTLLYAKIGPRVKKIIALAKTMQVTIEQHDDKKLDSIVKDLSVQAQDHRGVLLLDENPQKQNANYLSLDEFIQNTDFATNEKILIVVLDEITDPHNVGAILRSCDQFGVDLVIMSERNSPKNSEVVARSSAGASAWVKTAIVHNLNWAISKLKEKDFWVYAADAKGSIACEINFPNRIALIMGSEGNGVSRLLKEKCDEIISIPTQGKLDSLNVSVATGILLYEISR
ncbi:MAG: 23S rRNA (guanosine(2251)-2'-O)-methyltransferase RlmB [Treponemataceae bacterium]